MIIETTHNREATEDTNSEAKKDTALRLRQALCGLGLTPKDVAQLGIPYQTVYKHVTGSRNISAGSAVLYETILGIDRASLRPDLWPGHESECQHVHHEKQQEEM